MAGKVVAGEVEGLTCSLMGNLHGVSGSGTLATFQFNATASGWTLIQITFSDLLDSNGTSITHYIIDSLTIVVEQTNGGSAHEIPYED
jgi:hypothetical protein